MSRWLSIRLSLLAVFAVASTMFLGWIPDDSFISFRYAKNIARGLGPVFNPGERVEGVSNPLWTGALSLATRAGADTVVAAVALSALFAMFSVWLSFRLFDAALESTQRESRRKFVGLKTAMGVVLVGSMPMVFFATSGLETHAEAFFLLLGATLHLQARSRGRATHAGSVFCFLAVALLRPEGIAFLVAGIVWGLGARRKRSFLVAAGVALVVYVVFVFAKTQYYGSLLPNTYYAKPGASLSYPKPLFRGASYFVRFFLVSGLAVLLPFGISAWSRRPVGHVVVYLTSLIAIQIAFITFVGADVLRFDRFTIPFFPFLLALALIGFTELDAPSTERPRRASLWVAWCCAVIILFLNGGRFYLALNKLCIHDWMNARVHSRIGTLLGELLPGDSSVVLNEVGATAYRSDLTAIDMIGLTDRTIARTIYESYQRFGVSGSQWSTRRIADYLFSREPTCIVIPTYGVIDPWSPAPDAERFHPICEAIATHPLLAERYRPAFLVEVHDRKFLYFYVLKNIEVNLERARAIDGLPCTRVSLIPQR